jgi:drug/metabolite transporter (DMT)-like permease
MAAPSGGGTVALSIVAYSLCSGTLLLVNKLAMVAIPSAPLVTSIQCLFCIVSVGGCAALCGVPRLGAWPPSAPVLRAYALYSALFVIGIYTNMRALASTNVDTVIVFRAAVPLLVAAGDWVWMGREAPSPRSAAALAAVLVGCAAYVWADAAFRADGLRAYAWVGAYVVCIGAEMLLGKAITAQHEASLAASVLLTNAFALLPFLAIGSATGELARGLDSAHFSPRACAILAASCALSAGIGFSSWWARALVSATTFTVVGTLNKIVTVVLNIVVWDKHASPLGTAFLFLAIFAGAAYQQAPMRAAGKALAGDLALAGDAGDVELAQAEEKRAADAPLRNIADAAAATPEDTKSP